MKNNRKIEVIIKGSPENKSLVFEGLIYDIESEELRDIIYSMDTDNIIKLSKCIHGATYKLLKGE